MKKILFSFLGSIAIFGALSQIWVAPVDLNKNGLYIHFNATNGYYSFEYSKDLTNWQKIGYTFISVGETNGFNFINTDFSKNSSAFYKLKSITKDEYISVWTNIWKLNWSTNNFLN